MENRNKKARHIHLVANYNYCIALHLCKTVSMSRHLPRIPLCIKSTKKYQNILKCIHMYPNVSQCIQKQIVKNIQKIEKLFSI